MNKLFLMTVMLVGLLAPTSGASTTPKKLQVTSKSVTQGGSLAAAHTCDSPWEKTASFPNISWKGVPRGTKSFVLLVSDPHAAAGAFYHAGFYGIPGNVRQIKEQKAFFIVYPSAVTSSGTTFYSAPCPPEGEAHRYIFSVYALKNRVSARKGMTAAELESLLQRGKLRRRVLAVGSIEFGYLAPSMSEDRCLNQNRVWSCLTENESTVCSCGD